MKTLSYLVPLVLLAACSQSSKPTPVTPRQAPSTAQNAPPPAVTPAPTPPSGDSAAVLAAADTSLPLSEEIEELQQAADSAADAEVLEELENAVAEDRLTAARPRRKSATVEAVTWDIDVATFTNHDRVQYFLNFFQGPAARG